VPVVVVSGMSVFVVSCVAAVVVSGMVTVVSCEVETISVVGEF